MNQAWMKALVKDALEMGFSDFEIYMERSKRLSLSTYKGELDKFSSSEPVGVSVRGIYHGKMGNAYTEKLDEEALKFLLEDCKTNAEINETQEPVFIYKPQEISGEPYKNSGFDALSTQEKIEMLKSAEKKAAADVSGLDQLQNLYGDYQTQVTLVNSNGLEAHYETQMGYLYYAPIIKRGEDVKNESGMQVFTDFSQLRSEEVLREAIDRTNLMFGATTLASGKYKTILDNRCAGSLLEAMASIFSAEAVDKGLSGFKGKVGERVSSESLSIIDDPQFEKGLIRVPFDSEGVPTKRKALIEQGKLTGYLHNLKTANKFGVAPTGNGFKASFKSPVGISGTNLFIEAGQWSLEALLEKVETGIYITGLDGLHSGLNAITGDFSLSCRGRQIISGKLQGAIHQMTVSGNFFEMLMAVEGVCDNLYFENMDSSAVYGAPALSVGLLTYAGL